VSGGDKEFHKLYGKDANERRSSTSCSSIIATRLAVFVCVAGARECALYPGSTRERGLGTDQLVLSETSDRQLCALLGAGPSDYLSRVKTQIQLLYGIAESMLPRNETWWFFELGRHLERADNTSRIIDVKYYTLLPTSMPSDRRWTSCSGPPVLRRAPVSRPSARAGAAS